MKMLKPEIEFIEFDASDVIATSNCHLRKSNLGLQAG